jgi:hypothetical protein
MRNAKKKIKTGISGEDHPKNEKVTGTLLDHPINQPNINTMAKNA